MKRIVTFCVLACFMFDVTAARRSLDDLKNDETEIRRELERNLPEYGGDTAHSGSEWCVSAGGDIWNHCVRPAFESIPARGAPELAHNVEQEPFGNIGVEEYLLRFSEGERTHYVQATRVPRRLWGDLGALFYHTFQELPTHPVPHIQRLDLGLGDAWINGYNGVGVDTAGGIPEGQVGYRQVAMIKLHFTCSELSVEVGIEESLGFPSGMNVPGEPNYEQGKARYHEMTPHLESFAGRVAKAFRNHSVCDPASTTTNDVERQYQLTQAELDARMWAFVESGVPSSSPAPSQALQAPERYASEPQRPSNQNPNALGFGPTVVREQMTFWSGDAAQFVFDPLRDGPIFGRDITGAAEVSGELTGRTLTGQWVRYDGGQRCATRLHGSKNWGRVEFTFAEGFSSYQGRYGECDGDLTRSWNAQRVANLSLPQISVPTGPSTWVGDYGSFTFPSLADGSVTAVESVPGGVARLHGTKSELAFSGHWVRMDDVAQCSQALQGSRNWGRIELKFDPTYQTFRGYFGVCDATPDVPWNASRSQ